jgi:hypothetical protein
LAKCFEALVKEDDRFEVSNIVRVWSLKPWS